MTLGLRAAGAELGLRPARCRRGLVYTGHKDNLNLRAAQHHAGEIQGFTGQYLPVQLGWSQRFVTRGEGLGAERQIN